MLFSILLSVSAVYCIVRFLNTKFNNIDNDHKNRYVLFFKKYLTPTSDLPLGIAASAADTIKNINFHSENTEPKKNYHTHTSCLLGIHNDE